MNDSIIINFNKMLTSDRVNGRSEYGSELKIKYYEILSLIAHSHENYKRYYPKFLSGLEFNDSRSIAYSISVFFELFKKLIDSESFYPFDVSEIRDSMGDETGRKLLDAFKISFSKNNKQRISDDNFDISIFSEIEKKQVISFLLDKLQDDSKNFHWTNEMVQDTILTLGIYRQLLWSINKPEIFFLSIGILFDRLSTSELFQFGRDFCEEILISSYKHNVPEYGYFNSFRFYSNNQSAQAALVFANLSLTCVLKKGPPYLDKYVKEVIWQGIKCFRNIELIPWAEELYNLIPSKLDFSKYERRSIDHSYLASLLKLRSPGFPAMLIDYLHKEREELISNTEDAYPWLLMLYNLKRLYPEADFSQNSFGFYLNIFEWIVPKESVKKYKDIIEAQNSNLKLYLKESLIKLNETRNTSDFLYDNKNAIIISSRLIEYSYENNDYASFLLSMMLKSDYSILFQPRESQEFIQIALPEFNISDLEKLYESTPETLENLLSGNNCTIAWIAFVEGNLFQLVLHNFEYNIYKVTSWYYEKFQKLLTEEYFSNFTFSESIKDRGQIRLLSPEEFLKEENQVADKLSILKLSIPVDAKSLFIVKDMEISRFPHNLILNQNGEFIAKNIPVTNILSTEWLLHKNRTSSFPKDYTKSIWIPNLSGDIPLNYLYSNIEGTLKDHSFSVYQQNPLIKPLSSDINIICSHGGKNISEIQIVSHAENVTYNLDSVIGNGRILIFFVCYSGSMQTEFFRNNVSSLIKRFIARGYEAVIAPYWALDVTIPGIWLPEFLNSLNIGNSVSEATFYANKKVQERYPTPAAWACLHLYGNPNIKIQ